MVLTHFSDTTTEKYQILANKIFHTGTRTDDENGISFGCLATAELAAEFDVAPT